MYLYIYCMIKCMTRANDHKRTWSSTLCPGFESKQENQVQHVFFPEGTLQLGICGMHGLLAMSLLVGHSPGFFCIRIWLGIF